MGMNDSIYSLAESIKGTSEFSKLKQTKAVILRNPSLKRDMEEFNAAQKQVYSGKLTPKEVEARAQQLKVKFDSLSKIPEVDSYLKALEGFNRMMSNVYSNLNEYLEKGLS